MARAPFSVLNVNPRTVLPESRYCGTSHGSSTRTLEAKGLLDKGEGIAQADPLGALCGLRLGVSIACRLTGSRGIPSSGCIARLLAVCEFGGSPLSRHAQANALEFLHKDLNIVR